MYSKWLHNSRLFTTNKDGLAGEKKMMLGKGNRTQEWKKYIIRRRRNIKVEIW